MSILLYRWGRYAALHPWRVLLAWLLVASGVVALLATQPKVISGHLTLDNTPSQQVLDEVQRQLPQADGTRGTFVYTAVDGGRVDTPQRAQAIAEAVGRMQATGLLVDRESAIAEQRASIERQVAAQVTARFAQAAAGGAPAGTPPGDAPADPKAQLDAAIKDATLKALSDLETLQSGAGTGGAPLQSPAGPLPSVLVSSDGTVAVASVQLAKPVEKLPQADVDDLMAKATTPAAAGLSVAPSQSLTPVEPPLGGHEAIGIGVAALVLLLTLGSLVTAGLPILTALLGVLVGVGGAYALSSHFLMTTATPAIGLMLGLAVGIDYALFILHKHRATMLRDRTTAPESIGRSLGTSGNAVLFAGLTVVIALLGLLTLNIAFITTMAVVAAVTVILAVTIALTALPALLGLVGERVITARDRRTNRKGTRHPVASRWVNFVTSRPALTILGVVALLGALAIPASGLHLGMPSGAVSAPGSAARVNYDGVTHTLGEGANAALVVTMRPQEPAEVSQQDLLDWQQLLIQDEAVSNAQLAGSTPDRGLVIWNITPLGGPSDPATEDLVHRLREIDIPKAGSLGVTGLTAINIDLSEVLMAAIPLYLTVVVGLSLVVLLLVFRSVLVPIAATVGFLLSIAGTMGLVVTVFSNPGFTWLVGMDRAGPVLSFLPIMATGILYGLAMDYQVFLGTSIREEHANGTKAQQAVRSGFQHASRVVVAAAIIMMSVFGGFVLSADPTIRQFGFALSVGILVDAFLVRMTLLPAALHLFGERAWWLPRWLDRLLPKVDIEGDRLRDHLAGTPEST